MLDIKGMIVLADATLQNKVESMFSVFLYVFSEVFILSPNFIHTTLNADQSAEQVDQIIFTYKTILYKEANSTLIVKIGVHKIQ